MLSIAVAGKKTAHADEDFVNSVFETLAGIFRCTKEQLIRDYCFHSTTSTCCRNSDGTLSIKAVTKVGLWDAVRAWFGKWEMSFRHSSVHVNPFTLHRVGEDPHVGQTCLTFGIHRLCEHARNVLYRQKQGGKLGHSNHFLVAPDEVPFIIMKESKERPGHVTLYVKGDTFCLSVAMVRKQQ